VPVDHPHRRRELPKDRPDPLGGGRIQQPGEQLGGAPDADTAALVVTERLPFGRGEGPVDQRQHVAFLVAEMAVQLTGQGIHGVPEALVAAVAVGQGALDGGQHRVDAGVLVLHGLQQGQLVGAVGQVGAHAGPQVVVLGGVVDVQLGLEQLPAGQHGGVAGWLVQLGGAAAGGAGQVAEVAPEGVVEGDHQRQVQVAGRVAGHRHAPLGRAAVSVGCGIGSWSPPRRRPGRSCSGPA
jgi:hypothetical protein